MSLAIERRLKALQRRYLPDLRLGVWEVQLEPGDGDQARLVGRTTVAAALDELSRLASEVGAAMAVHSLPDPTAFEPRAVAYRSVAHLRREPGHGAELVTQIVMGEEALVLEVREPWVRVQLGDGYVGWIHQGSILRSPVPDLEAFRGQLAARRPRDDEWVVVIRGALARQGPQSDSPPAADLVQGARLAVEGDGDPLRVRLPDGSKAWLDRNAARPAGQLRAVFPPAGPSIVAHAAEFMGLPYLWGGTTEKGFDCSGLVQRIFGLHGVVLPRDADQQARVGEPVEAGSGWQGVRDGDLAFFVEPPGSRATHVGILATGGRMIHASTSRNGVAWDTFPPSGETSSLACTLAGWLTEIRRVLPNP